MTSSQNLDGIVNIVPVPVSYQFPCINLAHVKLVFLAACYSAGGKKRVEGTLYAVNPEDSIAQAFCDAGADCAVGFYGAIAPESPAFGYWHTRFWNEVRRGWSVNLAAQLASDDAAVQKWLKLLHQQLNVIIRGNGELLLLPAD